MDSPGSEYEPVASSYEHGNKTSSSINMAIVLSI
jgi:hypothetical protein